MLAMSIKMAVRNGVNCEIHDAITTLDTQQLRPAGQHDVNAALVGIVKLEAVYVQMQGPLPPTESTSHREAKVHFKS